MGMRMIGCAVVLLMAMNALGAEVEQNKPLPAGDVVLRKLLGERARTVEIWPGRGPDEPRPIPEESTKTPEGKPNAPHIDNVTRPTMTIIAPENAKGLAPSIVICPGGGYGTLSVANEGTDIAKWCNANGMVGIVLKYRVPKRNQGFAMYHQALQDAQRAMGIVRLNATEWGIDGKKVGILGFSAGGHLAASLCNNYEKRNYSRVDGADDVSCRPDFTVLIYPAYLTEPTDSDQLDPVQKVGEMSKARTPPTFIAVAQTDRFARGAADYFMALRAAKVPGELHIYDGGGHGSGMTAAPLSEWGVSCARWLKTRLDKSE